MGLILGRVVAAAIAGAVGASTVLAAAPAEADTTYTISGTLTLSTGAAADLTEIAACSADCSTSDAAIADVALPASGTGAFSLTVPAGTYALVVVDLDQEPGYEDASGAAVADGGYLGKRGSAGLYSLFDNFADAQQVDATSADVALSIQLGAAIHDPQTKFTSHTPGTMTDKPCVGYATTFQAPSFADLPSDASVTYRWYDGYPGPSTTPVATGQTYTSSTGQFQHELYVEVWATAPGRVDWDALVDVGQVLWGQCALTMMQPPTSDHVLGYGFKKGKSRAVHGKTVSVRAWSSHSAIAIAYTWRLNGKVAHHGPSYKLPRNAKGKKLVATVVFSEPGKVSSVETLSFGKVK